MAAATSGARTPRQVIAILATTQVLSWGSLYYAFSVLSAHMQRDLGLGPEAAVGAFSWALLVSGLAAAPAGRALDRIGGRRVMGLGSLGAGAGMLLLACVHSAATYWLAWTILGVSMSLTLYEAAFATINREVAAAPRRAISTLTLFGGLASTIFWPLTLQLDGMFGWRATWLVFGIAQLAVCAPLHALLPARAGGAAGARVPGAGLAEALRHPAFWKLAAAFAANSFVASALAVHLIGLMHAWGHALSDVVMLAALIGPMQVLGRLGEMSVARNMRPHTVGAITFATLPLALIVVLAFGRQLAVVALFCVLFGLGNGILTIVRGTLPQELFGRAHYGAISGALAAPSLVARALGPLAVAALMARGATAPTVLAVLLACAAASLACYLAALRWGRTDASASGAQALEHAVLVDRQVLERRE